MGQGCEGRGCDGEPAAATIRAARRRRTCCSPFPLLFLSFSPLSLASLSLLCEFMEGKVLETTSFLNFGGLGGNIIAAVSSPTFHLHLVQHQPPIQNPNHHTQKSKLISLWSLYTHLGNSIWDLKMEMERELVELFEAAKKAADAAAIDGAASGGPKVDRCIDVLSQLKNYPVTYDVLVSTQVAKRLRHLTKHPAEQIQTKVSDVLDIWKKIIINEASRKKNDGSDIKSSKKTEVTETKSVKVQEVRKPGSFSRSESIKVEKKVGAVDTVKAEKIPKEEKHIVSKTETIKVEKKVGTVDKAEKTDWSNTVKVEKPASSAKKPSQASNAPPKLKSLLKCNDAVRDKLRELLLEAFAKVPEEVNEDMKDEVDASDPMRVAVSVESVMFEKMGRSNGAQKVKYRSIMFNLKDPKNPDLRRRVLLGQVEPERLINMTPEEMASDERQRENKHIKERALFDCERGGAPKATTDQFKCGRCGKRMCTYYQLQTRSADEPMTTFVTCVNCNNHWKFC